MVTELNFNKALLASLALHLIILFILPDLKPFQALPDKFMEIDLVKIPKPKIRKVARRIVPKPARQKSRRKAPARKIVEALPPVRGKIQVSAPPAVSMPRRQVANETPLIDVTSLDKRDYEEPAGRREYAASEKMAYFASKREPLEFESLRIGEKKAPLIVDERAGGSKEFPLPLVESAAPAMPKLGLTDYGGTVGRRKILVAPQVPQVEIVSRSVTIRIRFDVTTDGTVVNARPENKGGDAKLEQIAIEIAQKYKFVPLPSDVEQSIQWGVLPVTFRQ